MSDKICYRTQEKGHMRPLTDVLRVASPLFFSATFVCAACVGPGDSMDRLVSQCFGHVPDGCVFDDGENGDDCQRADDFERKNQEVKTTA